MVRSWFSAGAVLLCVALAAAPVRADDGAAPAKEQARYHTDRGNTYYYLGRYRDALTEYSRAYAAFAAPPLLFNMGQCHRQLRDHAAAAREFQEYLRQRPDARNAGLARELLAESRRSLAARREVAKLALRAPALAPTNLPDPRIDARADPAPEPRPPVYKRWWFWTVIAGVAAVSVTAAVVAGSSGHATLPAGSLGTVDRR
ncbi:MAG TPA: tetratricopeptide repeat protein [Polyangia bacterium]|jgi:tetratricopeptide (TPR) repeat protein